MLPVSQTSARKDRDLDDKVGGTQARPPALEGKHSNNLLPCSPRQSALSHLSHLYKPDRNLECAQDRTGNLIIVRTPSKIVIQREMVPLSAPETSSASVSPALTSSSSISDNSWTPHYEIKTTPTSSTSSATFGGKSVTPPVMNQDRHPTKGGNKLNITAGPTQRWSSNNLTLASAAPPTPSSVENPSLTQPGSQPASGPQSVSDPKETWNLILTGVSDGRAWHPNTMAMAKVDIIIVRIVSIDGKFNPSEPRDQVKVSRIVGKRVELEMVTASTSSQIPESKMVPSISAASRCPVIAIPAAGIDSKVRGLKVLVAVTVPARSALEEKSKRRRNAPAKRDEKNFVYFEKTERGAFVKSEPLQDKEEPETYAGNGYLFHRYFRDEENELKEKDLYIQLKKSPENSGNSIPSSETGARIFMTIQKSKKQLPDFVPPPKHMLPPLSPGASGGTKSAISVKVEKKDCETSKEKESAPSTPPPSHPLFPVDLGPTPNWLRIRTQRTISEYTDVNEGEKKLMTMWNAFMQTHHGIRGDCQMEWACKRFVELHGEELLTQNLRLNFTLHLTNLFDFGLLASQQVRTIIEKLDSSQKPKEGAGHSSTIVKIENEG